MAAVDAVNLVKRAVTDIVGRSGKTYSFKPKGTPGSKLRLDSDEVSSIQFQDMKRSGILALHSIQIRPATTPAKDTAQSKGVKKPKPSRRTRRS